jgi:NADH-quinone oxidoreductase subunit A
VVPRAQARCGSAPSHHNITARHAHRGGDPVMPDYVPVLILMGLALAFAILVTLLTFVFGPKKPTPEKLAPYECGIEEIEPPRQRFPVKYLTTGMLFIIFDVEAASILPLAILMRQLKVMGFVELLIFAVVLIVPFFYVWRKGAFTWE